MKRLYTAEKFFLNIASFHWLLQGKMTPKNRTVSTNERSQETLLMISDKFNVMTTFTISFKIATVDLIWKRFADNHKNAVR